MLMITDTVCLVRMAVFVCFIAFSTCESAPDYCEKDNAMCDEDGVYKHIAVTSYDDYAIRDKLDDDHELIGIRPRAALKKTNQTLAKYPNRWDTNFIRTFLLKKCHNMLSKNLISVPEQCLTNCWP